MLNHELEELIVLYKKYIFKTYLKYTKKFIIFTSYIFVFSILTFIAIFVSKQDFKTNIPNTKLVKNTKILEDKKMQNKYIVKNNKQINNKNLNYKNSIKIKKSKKSPDNFIVIINKKDSLKALLDNEKQKFSYYSALAIANYFFNKKRYKRAVFWAIKASKRAPSKTDAWIIYAKSKILLGEKQKAKAALTSYLEQFSSIKIKKLLNDI